MFYMTPINSIAKLKIRPKLVAKNNTAALFSCQSLNISEVISTSKNSHHKTPPTWIELHYCFEFISINFYFILVHDIWTNTHTFMQFCESRHPLLRGMESFYTGVLLCLSRTNNWQKFFCTRCQPSLWRHKEEQDVLVLKQEKEGSFPDL